MTNCKNCDNHFEGNFCHQCGQSAHTHPLNLHFVWHDIQHGLLHFDKGVPYTLKALFTKPGHAIRDYVNGKRINFFKPVSLIILLATLYALLSLYFKVSVAGGIRFSDDPKQLQIAAQFERWVNAHYVGYMLLTLPFWTIGSYLSFFKQRYNLIEHFVLNAYVIVQMLTIQILLFPINLYYQNTPSQGLFVTLSIVLYVIISAWTYTQFFHKLSKIKAIFYTLLSYVIMIAILMAVAIVVGIALSIFMKI